MAILLAPKTALARGQALDRVVAAVGAAAITASDVDKEYRLELFLDGKVPNATAQDADAATLDQVRGRIIDRTLLEEEAQTSGIKVAPDDPAVDQRLAELRSKFPSPGAFEAGLQALGMREEDLRQVLATEEQILRLIDQRLRPEATVESSEIEAYYRDKFLPELSRQGQTQPPPLSEVEDRIREILTQQKIDVLLGQWVSRLRLNRDVRIYGSALAEYKP
ncbi:MAG TPA: SurA N-terminal domain-containing protein [Terriglobia bacterium]